MILKRHLSNTIFLVFLVFGSAALAFAGPITVTMTNSASNLGGPASNGVYYYPYVLSANGVNMNVVCNDYYDDVNLGESWQAQVNTFNDLSGTLFYNSGAGVSNYQKAAWLFTQFQPTPPMTNNVNAAINFAIWDLFASSAPGIDGGYTNSQSAVQTDFSSDSLDTDNSAYWLNQAGLEAAGGFSGVDFSRFVIFTPTSWSDVDSDGSVNALDDRPQEYIGEVPEPSTVFLWLTGLAGLGLAAWKRRGEETLAG